MRKVTVDEVEVSPVISPADVVRPLTEPLGTEDVAINRFELAPGEQFGFDYHRHLDQEEVFYVERGVATFETEDGDVEVGAGELVRFAPGEFQLGRNLGEARVVALAIGAPRGSREIEYRRHCPACDESTIQAPEPGDDGRSVVIRCSSCETAVEEIAR